MKKFVDMHIHSVKSDGTYSYEEIIELIKEKNVEVFSITDHNIIPDIELLNQYAKENYLTYIPGVEIDCRFEDIIIHILVYGFDKNSISGSKLKKAVKKSREILDKMSVDLIKKMEKDYDFTIDEYEKFQRSISLGGWKGIQFLQHKGITENLIDGMSFYKKYDCDYGDYDFPRVKDICDFAKEIGGYAVLAHPSKWFSSLNKKELINVFETIKKLGITGIECFYPLNDKIMTQTAIEFCKNNNMLITAGGDFHGNFFKTVNYVVYDLAITKTVLEDVEISPLMVEIKEN